MSVQEFVQAFSQAVRVSGTLQSWECCCVPVSVSQCVASEVVKRVVVACNLSWKEAHAACKTCGRHQWQYQHLPTSSGSHTSLIFPCAHACCIPLYCHATLQRVAEQAEQWDFSRCNFCATA
jgi:hypothetical protein